MRCARGLPFDVVDGDTSWLRRLAQFRRLFTQLPTKVRVVLVALLMVVEVAIGWRIGLSAALPTSLLRWTQRFIALRRQHRIFGLGTYEVLRPENSRIFACIRRYEGEVVLCVHNLARSAQAVELDLSEFEGLIPEEMFGKSRFPRIGKLPYLLTLAGRGFFWFQLVADDA